MQNLHPTESEGREHQGTEDGGDHQPTTQAQPQPQPSQHQSIVYLLQSKQAATHRLLEMSYYLSFPCTTPSYCRVKINTYYDYYYYTNPNPTHITSDRTIEKNLLIIYSVESWSAKHKSPARPRWTV